MLKDRGDCYSSGIYFSINCSTILLTGLLFLLSTKIHATVDALSKATLISCHDGVQAAVQVYRIATIKYSGIHTGRKSHETIE